MKYSENKIDLRKTRKGVYRIIRAGRLIEYMRYGRNPDHLCFHRRICGHCIREEYPLGDVTTTMLWIGNQITAVKVKNSQNNTPRFARNFIFRAGILSLLSVPLFKTLTHLPPLMGMEKIDFMWYLRKISWLALAGYFAGALVYMLQNSILNP